MAGIERTWALDGMGNGAYAIGPFDNNRTNEPGLLAAKATDYLPGTVLGRITATGIYTPLNPAANDGSQNFAGINWARHSAFASGTKRAAITVRELTINSNLLVYDIAVSGPQKTAIELQMKAAGIIPGN